MAPFATEEASAFPDQLTKEVKEFAPLNGYHPHLHYYPHTTYINTLYVYPLSLKYDTQKMFTKVRCVHKCYYNDGLIIVLKIFLTYVYI